MIKSVTRIVHGKLGKRQDALLLSSVKTKVTYVIHMPEIVI